MRLNYLYNQYDMSIFLTEIRYYFGIKIGVCEGAASKSASARVRQLPTWGCLGTGVVKRNNPSAT